MPTLLSASSSLLREFWGLKSPQKTGAGTAPDPLPRFDKLEPAHASSVVSFTRTCSQMMAAFVGVSIAHVIAWGGRFSKRAVCSGMCGRFGIWGWKKAWGIYRFIEETVGHESRRLLHGPGTDLPQASQLDDPPSNFLSKKRAAPSAPVPASNPRKKRKNRNKNRFSALDEDDGGEKDWGRGSISTSLG